MKKIKPKRLVSLVLPIYNEAESIPFLLVELQKLSNKLRPLYQLEFIFVDDGSSDKTVAILSEYRAVLPIHILSFSRNFGHQAALIAGLRQSKGDIVISLDSDLQHPPSFIPKLIAASQKGYEIVFTERRDDESLGRFKKLSSFLFYKCLNMFSDIKVQEAGSDFRLMTRPALDAVLSLPENRIFLRGMVSWIGFRTITLPFNSPPRKRGVSKYNLYKMLKLATFGIASFSTAPLYLSVIIGFIFSAATVLYGIYVLYVRFITHGAVAGWSSVIFVLLGIGSILSFLLAIIGVYLAAMYDEVKRRPVYIIKSYQRAKGRS